MISLYTSVLVLPSTMFMYTKKKCSKTFSKQFEEYANLIQNLFEQICCDLLQSRHPNCVALEAEVRPKYYLLCELNILAFLAAKKRLSPKLMQAGALQNRKREAVGCLELSWCSQG